MVDIHAHILPGVDDGPEEWDKSVKMLLRASEDGIKGIVAAPHVAPGLYDNDREKVLALVEEMRRRAGAVPIEIYPGSEISVSPETLNGLAGKRYCTINSSRYVLIELPGHFAPDAAYDFIFSLTSRGFVPVVAHPERNARVESDIEILYELVRLGALMQITSGSLAGLFGSRVKSLAQDVLGRRLAHVMASDAHNNGGRAPLLSDGLREASRIIGGRAASAMVRDVPARMLRDEAFETQEPLYPRKAFYFF